MAVVTRLERKSRRWEQVWQGESEAVASIVAGGLEADGIRTRIHGHTTPYRTAAFNLGGSWAILVPAGKAAHARGLLREHDEAHNVIEPEDGSGLTTQQRSTIRFAILLFVGFALLIGGAAALGRL